jgi:hypothetical protein
MLLADKFVEDAQYRSEAFGVAITDHPLVVQFASNSPSTFLAAALLAQSLGADGVDLNLGCPQKRAREDHYGSWMTDPSDWELCCDIIATSSSSDKLLIPVTVKIRLQEEVSSVDPTSGGGSSSALGISLDNKYAGLSDGDDDDDDSGPANPEEAYANTIAFAKKV